MEERDNKEKKISFRLNNYLYRFVSAWAMERHIEISEAIRMFCQNFYMDYMKGELEYKPLMPIEQKRQKFLELIKSIGTNDMRRLCRNPEICGLMNGALYDGKRTRTAKKKTKPVARAKAKNKA